MTRTGTNPVAIVKNVSYMQSEKQFSNIVPGVQKMINILFQTKKKKLKQNKANKTRKKTFSCQKIHKY